MLTSSSHRLLRRQIRNAGFDEKELEKFKDFFDLVDDAYTSFDDDINHFELILEESSNELFKANRSLVSKVYNAESKLNNIVNTIEGVIFKTDMKGCFKYLNKASIDLLGISADKVRGKSYRELLNGINAKEKNRLKKFFKDEQKDYTTIFKYIKPNGDKVWIQLKLVLTYNKRGTAIGTIGTMTDVTQLKETEIELNQANKIKDEFLSTMSHEIRTPLNAVIGMSEILLMEKYLPEQLENIQVLKYSSEHLLALINDLLDLNKYKSEEIKLIEEDFNFNELIQNINLHFKQTASQNNLRFETKLDKEIPTMLIGDSLKFSQVLKNLLSNAFKFTHEGGIVFTANIEESYTNSTKIRFSIKDTGIGVSYNKQKDIFKSFAQANQNISTLYGGSGLGLYISKQLLKIQNSELHLESKMGKGSTFWFDLDFQHSQKKISTMSSYVANTSPIALNVLVAEDNNINSLLIKKLFEKWDVDYVIANNGQQLLDIYKDFDFDLILMDLQMPILDGYDTTRAIRKIKDSSKSAIPIIALTAYTRSEVKEKTERYKMDGYLSKPFNVNELHKLLSFYSSKKQNVV